MDRAWALYVFENDTLKLKHTFARTLQPPRAQRPIVRMTLPGTNIMRKDEVGKQTPGLYILPGGFSTQIFPLLHQL